MYPWIIHVFIKKNSTCVVPPSRLFLLLYRSSCPGYLGLFCYRWRPVDSRTFTPLKKTELAKQSIYRFLVGVYSISRKLHFILGLFLVRWFIGFCVQKTRPCIVAGDWLLRCSEIVRSTVGTPHIARASHWRISVLNQFSAVHYFVVVDL